MNVIQEITELIKGFAVLLVFIVSQLTSFPLVKTSPQPTATQSAQPNQVVSSNLVTPTPMIEYREAPSSQHQPVDNYKLEPHPDGEEGFYVLKNTIPEPMSTKEDLNNAVNSYRKAHNLNELRIDEDLCGIATERASEAKVHFSHQEFQQHIENGDYNDIDFSVIGENLWQGSFSGVHIVEYGWDRSPGHRANLQGDWTRGCAGIDETTAVYIFAR